MPPPLGTTDTVQKILLNLPHEYHPTSLTVQTLISKCNEQLRLLDCRIGKPFGKHDTRDVRAACCLEHVLRASGKRVPPFVLSKAVGIPLKKFQEVCAKLRNYLDQEGPGCGNVPVFAVAGVKRQRSDFSGDRGGDEFPCTLIPTLTIQIGCEFSDANRSSSRATGLFERVVRFMRNSMNKGWMEDFQRRPNLYEAVCLYHCVREEEKEGGGTLKDAIVGGARLSEDDFDAVLISLEMILEEMEDKGEFGEGRDAKRARKEEEGCTGERANDFEEDGDDNHARKVFDDIEPICETHDTEDFLNWRVEVLNRAMGEAVLKLKEELGTGVKITDRDAIAKAANDVLERYNITSAD